MRAIRACSVDRSHDVVEGRYQFGMLYIFLITSHAYINSFFAPETLQEPVWRKVISSETFKARLVLVAVDDAHCISEWLGNSRVVSLYCLILVGVRTDFEKIGGLRALTSVPFMALTASAPPEVRATIIKLLHLSNPVYVEGSLDRPNIYMSASTIKSVNVSVRLSR